MSKCPLKTLFIAKFISVLLFVVVGLTVSKCKPTQPNVVKTSSLKYSLKKDSIAQLKISVIDPKDFISPSGATEGTDQWVIEFIMFNNPQLTYDEAEKLMWEWNSEGVK